jgi:transcription elongation factor Elf1
MKNKNACLFCGSTEDTSILAKKINGNHTYICRVCNRSKIKKYYDHKKNLVFSHYGADCRCCGETEVSFLSIDHVNNDGHLEKWPSGHRIAGRQLYQRIVRDNYPDKYQVLCMNCNHGKRMNNGVCPHEMVKLVQI